MRRTKTNGNLYQTVLSVVNSTISMPDDSIIPVKTVYWCFLDSETKTTLKTAYICKSVYIKNKKSQGLDVRSFKKPVSIKKSGIMQALRDLDLKHNWGFIGSTHAEALKDAYRAYILNTPALSKNIDAEVLSFDKNRGSGLVRIQGGVYDVYACNIEGKKTWYPETACMYLNKSDTVKVNLTGAYFKLFVNVIQGGIFDSDKWDRLDQDKLAFKVNAVGTLKNGLFA